MTTGDLDALTLVPGVGKKVAGRIVLDLRDRMGAGGDLATSGPYQYPRTANRMLQFLVDHPDDPSIDELLEKYR